MGLLQKLKSALGFDGTGSVTSNGTGEVDVTVERDPSTEDEDAVKGTDTATATEPTVESDAEPSVSAMDTETEAIDSSESEATSSDVTEESTTTESTADTEESAPPADRESVQPADEGSDESVTEIKGIGPAYAERLSGIGIETVGDLAAADAADIAAETDLSESRVAGWIERASEY